MGFNPKPKFQILLRGWNEIHRSPGFTLNWKNSSKEQRRFWSSRAGLSINVSLWAKHLWQIKLQRHHLLSCSISWSWGLMAIRKNRTQTSLMGVTEFQGFTPVQTNVHRSTRGEWFKFKFLPNTSNLHEVQLQPPWKLTPGLNSKLEVGYHHRDPAKISPPWMDH